MTLNFNLTGKTALVTAGPTIEPIDPVRFLSNHSSGRQGVAIASALQKAGVKVTLVSGPLQVPVPDGITHIKIQTAEEMLKTCFETLPVDIAVCAAAVADYRPAQQQDHKIKKSGKAPVIELIENPDILKTIAQHPAQRPKYVIGFAAETENVTENAVTKLKRKGCDAIIANDVKSDAIFGGLSNRAQWITVAGIEFWPLQSKEDVAGKIVEKINQFFN